MSKTDVACRFKPAAVLVISSNDGLAPQTERLMTAVNKNAGAQVVTHHFATDHSYSDQRIAMEAAVLNWLATLR